MAMLSLATQLRNRGHSTTFFHLHDLEAEVVSAGHHFRAVGETTFPIGTRRIWDDKYSRAVGSAALRICVERAIAQAQVFFAEAPSTILATRVDALVVDEIAIFGDVIAEYLRLPFVTFASAVPVVVDLNIPPFIRAWRYRKGAFWRWRNKVGYRTISRAAKPLTALVEEQRRIWKLRPLFEAKRKPASSATVTQLPACVDFPRRSRERFYHTGPFTVSSPTSDVPFPWNQLDGRPIVYASLGTAQAGIERVFNNIAKACRTIDVQLVMSLGGGPISPDELGLPSEKSIIVRYAPQRELIPRSLLVISHGGANTVLEALWHGVPMIVIPLANDQPGMAARVERAGAGRVLLPRRSSAGRIRREILRLLDDPSYRNAALGLQAQLRLCDGPSRAAEIIEQAVTTSL